MRGLVRVGAAVPSLALGNVKENMKRHLAMMREAKEKHVSIVTFPELSLTGYTCGDLFFQRRLLDDVTDALLALKEEMPEGILRSSVRRWKLRAHCITARWCCTKAKSSVLCRKRSCPITANSMRSAGFSRGMRAGMHRSPFRS